MGLAVPLPDQTERKGFLSLEQRNPFCEIAGVLCIRQLLYRLEKGIEQRGFHRTRPEHGGGDSVNGEQNDRSAIAAARDFVRACCDRAADAQGGE